MSLKSERTAIANVLKAAGLTAHEGFPERVSPPVVVMQAGSPYLTNGSVFGSFLCRWEATVIHGTGASEKVQNDLDADAEEALVALVNAGYSVESVSQPFLLTIGTANHPAVQLTFTKEITL